MSKIGKLPITITEGVTVEITGATVKTTGPKGSFTHTIPAGIRVSIVEGKILVEQKAEGMDKDVVATLGAMHGLTRATLANMVEGASKGFEKRLELSGVGYRAQVNGTELVLSVGYSHPVKFKAPEGIIFKVADNGILVSGSNKSHVGDMAAKIRAVRPPEPYKGKGISYAGEKIRRKAGKAAKAVGGK